MGQDANYYRNPDRIYLDSKDGHQGAFLWKMKKAGDRIWMYSSGGDVDPHAAE